MPSKKTLRIIRRSLFVILMIFLFVSFWMRFFSSGFVFFDLEELTKTFVFIGVPAFALVYIIFEIIYMEKRDDNQE